MKLGKLIRLRWMKPSKEQVCSFYEWFRMQTYDSFIQVVSMEESLLTKILSLCAKPASVENGIA